MKAYKKHMEIFNPITRDVNDLQKFISKAVFSYISESGYEYRRAFTSEPNQSEMYFWNLAPNSIIVKE